MDNDLMARRLRPPSQPSTGNGQQPPLPSPWDVPLAPDEQFAPPQEQFAPPQDPQFAPPDRQLGPDPQLRADVPWDRPDPEPWPPTADDPADFAQTWSAQGGGPAAQYPQPDLPVADSLSGSGTPPWDRPAADDDDQSHDPYDAMAPVVSDVTQTPASVWASWNGNGQYAAAGTPEPMRVAAHSDRPLDSDAPWSTPWDEPSSTPTTPGNPVSGSASGTGDFTRHDPLPEWPAEDDLAIAPPTDRGPVMPEDSWPVTPSVVPPDPLEARAPFNPEPVMSESAAAASEPAFEEAAFDSEPAAAEPAPVAPEALLAAPEPAPVEVPAEPAPAEAPVVAQPTIPAPEAPTLSAMMMPAGLPPQNMVLRIEVAIVDEGRRANPADAAKRVGPDADVRRPEYEPRNHGGRASMPEPEYLWDAPPKAPDQAAQRRPQPAPGTAEPPASARRVSPPPSAWRPAPSTQPEPMTMDWDLPPVSGPQPMANPPAPWSTPAQAQPPHQPPIQAPAPTWALTQPTQPPEPPIPSYQPPAPQYQPQAPQYQPPGPQYQPPAYEAPAAPQYQPPAPQYQPPAYEAPAAPQYQPQYQPQSYAPSSYPTQAQSSQDYRPAVAQSAWPPADLGQQPLDPLASLPAVPFAPPQMPAQPVQSAAAAGSRARTGQAAADQADLWFLSNQPSAVAVAEDDVQPEGQTSSILTAGLTIGFAILVIVLVLVFIQLMTSLLR